LLPEGVPWPKNARGQHLDYLGLVDLTALTSAGSSALEPRWPNTGVLSIFVEHLGSAAEPVVLRFVHAAVGIETLVEPLPPEPSAVVGHESLVDLQGVNVAAVPSVSIPTTSRRVKRLVRAAEEPDAAVILDELLWGIAPKNAIGQVGGWANSHQDDLYRQTALRALGRGELVYADYWDSLDEYEASILQHPGAARMYRGKRKSVLWLLEHAQVVAAEAERWSLVLRLSSNREMGLLINDSDPLFVFMPKDDLSAARFDRVTGCVLQG
jgi:hypothetical protein